MWSHLEYSDKKPTPFTFIQKLLLGLLVVVVIGTLWSLS